ncbi:MAG: prephenate dehydrogenase [Lachnospiraceae bacterium]|nr:prephenate dehydrogenase [Lachnospiraceae bacterium]
MKSYTYGFIGLGLIGASIAKSIRRVYKDCTIIGYNRSEGARTLALSDGTIDVATDKIDENFSKCDYIFLCTPVEYNCEYLKQLKNIIKDDCIITDVGSTKESIHKMVSSEGLEKNFIGGHPMAGSEKTGYENSSDRLVENAFFAITPTKDSPREKIDEYKQLVTDIGAIPVILSCEEHDFCVAGISHLPHIIASQLVNLVHDNDIPSQTMHQLAAGGFKDITRIASSSSNMWEQICMTNTSNIVTLLDKYIGLLSKTKYELEQKNGKYIYDMFTDSREYRDTFEERGHGPIQKTFRLYTDIIDETGAIARISTILALNKINIKNIGITHNREFQEGVLAIEFESQNDMDMAKDTLIKFGFTVHNPR